MDFKIADPDFEARTRDSFARQGMMNFLGARLSRVEAGLVEIRLAFRDDLTQQHGYFHAGATSTIGDTAGGYAAYTLLPMEATALTTEFKINLLAPADGQELRALGRVIKPGRTLTVCDIEVFAVKDGRERMCAKILQTMMSLHGKPDTRA